MPQDAFTLLRMSIELDGLLKGGKINKINQPDKEQVYMHVYSGGNTHKMAFSAHPQSARIGYSLKEKENPLTALNFCMLLRKHLLGGVIDGISLVGFDRVVAVKITNKNDFFEKTEKILYCEIMGKYSNLILTENGVILGALKTSSGIDDNTKRILYAGVKYSLPPPQDKLNYLDREALAPLLENFSGENLGEFLFSRVSGLSFLTAEEIAHSFKRAEGSIYEHMKRFIEDAPLNPCVLDFNLKGGDFFAFPYTHLVGEVKRFDRLIDAQDYYYYKRDYERDFLGKKRAMLQAVKNRENKCLKRLSIIENKQKDCSDMELNKLKGELLLSNIYRLKDGMESCELENYYDELGGKIQIALDGNYSVAANAQRYFKKYNKQKKTVSAIAPQREEALAELDYLTALKKQIERSLDDEFKDIEDELKAEGLMKSTTVKKSKKIVENPGIEYEIDGFTIKAGKNNIQNDKLTLSARSFDLWLHTKDFHSSHVVVSGKGDAPDKVIEAAAEICAYYSEAREGGKVPVDYTLKKFVKKPAGAKPGFVVYTDHKTIYVSANKHEELLKREP